MELLLLPVVPVALTVAGIGCLVFRRRRIRIALELMTRVDEEREARRRAEIELVEARARIAELEGSSGTGERPTSFGIGA